jgi:hypothetical protein
MQSVLQLKLPPEAQHAERAPLHWVEQPPQLVVVLTSVHVPLQHIWFVPLHI